jgi:Arc/MetJ-type ribon-helix-helix transcriptional regulator
MTFPVPAEYAEFFNHCLASGEFASEQDVAKAALSLLKARQDFLVEIDRGLADFERGDYTTYGPNDREQFLADIKAESARLAKEKG